jgi:hypothetical protein
MDVYSERERCARGISQAAPGDTSGRQRVGEGDERSRWLFVADEFARQAHTGTDISVQDVQQGRGRAAGGRRSRRRRVRKLREEGIAGGVGTGV